MSRENHKIFQNPETLDFTGFSALQLWVQLWGGCNEGKTITGGLYTDLMKVLQSKNRGCRQTASNTHYHTNAIT